MSQRIFSINTANFFYELVVFAEKVHALRSGTANSFLHVWVDVDWSSKESIRPLVEIIELAYALAPRSEFSPHRELDASLVTDGYRLRNGKLGRPNVNEPDSEKKEIVAPTAGLYESRKKMISDIEPIHS